MKRVPLYGLAALLLLFLLIPVRRPVRVYSEQAQVLRFQRDSTPISVYDTLIRQWADSIGWDWRLVAAVIYHESRFNNNVHSNAGAKGLMQINNSRYSDDELLNPATNIQIGTRYLKKLEGMFADVASSALESRKFALAAFNMGDGKMRQLIEKARADSLDTAYWENVARELPTGHHTRSYVRKVMDTYADYRLKYPSHAPSDTVPTN